MSDDSSVAIQIPATVIVPEAVKQKFPDLVELILHSESMNDDERQYWLNILIDMTPEQVTQLRSILTNERDQLASIDAKYAKDMNDNGQVQDIISSEERQKRSRERTQKEIQDHAEEEAQAAAALKEIE